MSHYADYRLECYDIHSFEDENGFFACKAFDDENGKRLHIEDMWIKTELRDKKIGQKYEEQIFNYAKENGYDKVTCSIYLHNPTANETLSKFLYGNWKLAWLSGDYISLVKDAKCDVYKRMKDEKMD